MKHKILGIPIGTALIIALIITLTVGVAAAWLFTRSLPSTVEVLSAGAEVYSNPECTEILTHLDFGIVHAEGEGSDTLPMWIKNSGDDPVYFNLQTTGLAVGLSLTANGDTIPADPDTLILGTGTAVDDETTLLGGINDSQVIIEVASITEFPESGTLHCEDEVITYTGLRDYQAGQPEQYVDTATSTIIEGNVFDIHDTGIWVMTVMNFPESGYFRVDSELVSYAERILAGGADMLEGCVRGIDGTTTVLHEVGALVTLVDYIPEVAEVLAAFTGCTRGGDGTTAASHADGTAIYTEKSIVTPVGIGESIQVDLVLTAGGSAERGIHPFTLTINGQTTPF